MSIFEKHVLYYNHITIMCESIIFSTEGKGGKEFACKMVFKAYLYLQIFLAILIRLNYNGGGMGSTGIPSSSPFISARDLLKGHRHGLIMSISNRDRVDYFK